DFLGKTHDSDSLVFCHTSGTTNSNLSMLKWFYMTKDIVKRQWAPGMQAIFESSGLDSKSSAVIFVPSRLKFDGLNKYEDKEYISLYSSEFSQRIMLSIIKPRLYLFNEYKNSKNLEILSQILAIENVSVISAPATTILGWADINRLKIGLKKSLNSIRQNQDPLTERILLEIKKKGLNSVSKDIHKRLSDKISKATLVFSISSLSEYDWELIRKFMKWEKGEEKFTNLYVASETGPFAASITKGDFEISRLNRMYIFPLTLPVIEYKGKKEAVSRTKNKMGRLYVSRLDNSGVLININVGDVISIKNQEGLPQIDGRILRSSFQLKYPINLSKEIVIQPHYKVFAGDYFSFSNFEFYNPRRLLNCLKDNCGLNIDSLLLIRKNKASDKPWMLFLHSNGKKNCSNLKNYSKILLDCILNNELKEAILNSEIKIKLINEDPVDFLVTRSEVLEKVRSGKNPKGILKKWPLYVIEG
ncbi:MAG: hypothetical protein HWN81_16090, partial [Candidatus Lokiarchaeota archaeon]|nr:hypothetical protein [Candidatus Lokiarchaeota archaeon]